MKRLLSLGILMLLLAACGHRGPLVPPGQDGAGTAPAKDHHAPF